MDTDKIFTAMREAGRAVMQIYKTDFDVQWKGECDPLTKADLESDEILQMELGKYGHPILSEETEDDKARLGSEYVWIIDPLDGTHEFVNSTDEFCIMVGLIHFGEPIFGAIYLPVEDTLYFAEKGKGAWVEKNNTRLKVSVSVEHDVTKSFTVVTRSHMDSIMQKTIADIAPKKMTPVGSNGLKATFVADGSADFFINPTNKMGEWDVVAPHIIIKEAGGEVTDTRGEKLAYNKPNPNTPYGILATNGILHDIIISKIT